MSIYAARLGKTGWYVVLVVSPTEEIVVCSAINGQVARDTAQQLTEYRRTHP